MIAGSASALTYTTLDAPLSLFAKQPETALKLYAGHASVSSGVSGAMLKSSASTRLSVLIRIADESAADDAIAAIAATGTTVRSRLGPILTADVPLAALNELANLDSIMLVELSRPMPSRLNFSVPATGASTLRAGVAPQWTGLTGKGVIVGIIDDGVDFRHLDFRKPNGGGTRLLGLWDMRQAGAAGTPPQGYNYGGECTPAMMDAAINGNAAACTQPSAGGHGTHVAGIAAGNGQGAGNGTAAYRFVGMAPEADILSANWSAAGGAVLDAIAWMKAKAAAAGKPLVINMSFGSYYGPRDGTSIFEEGASAAGGPGVILVAAGGNEGDAPIRAEGPLSQGGQVAFDLNLPQRSVAGGATIEAWYPGTDVLSFVVQGPGCAATAAITADVVLETACGQVNVTLAGPFATNDDRQVQVLLAPGTSPLKEGAWKLTVNGTTIAKPNTPLGIVTGEVNGGLTITAVNGAPLPAVTSKILTDAASAKRVIGVAAYNTSYTWTDSQGAPANPGMLGPLDDLSTYSSRGPRRDCSNAAKCPPVMKPEITSPGTYVMSTKAVDHTAGATFIEQDGVHTTKIGTSMATPHVSGAVALLLQKKSTLTPEEVKQLLFANIKKTAFTPAVPTYTGADVPAAPSFDWGYGVLDVAKAANAIPNGATAALTVTRNGSGTGSIASNPAGIACGATCNQSFALATPVALTATADGGSVFTGWLGACTGVATCNVTMGAATNVSATFALGATIPTPDIDGDTRFDALTDGLLILRYMFGLTGQPLTANAVSTGAPRTNPTVIGNYVLDVRPRLDIDGDGKVDALTDGQLLLRYLFGLRGPPLISGAVSASATRTTFDAIQNYIASILQ